MELALTVFGVIFAALAAPIAVFIAFILVLSALVYGIIMPIGFIAKKDRGLAEEQVKGGGIDDHR